MDDVVVLDFYTQRGKKYPPVLCVVQNGPLFIHVSIFVGGGGSSHFHVLLSKAFSHGFLWGILMVYLLFICFISVYFY